MADDIATALMGCWLGVVLTLAFGIAWMKFVEYVERKNSADDQSKRDAGQRTAGDPSVRRHDGGKDA